MEYNGGSERYINREISWLQFNERVLQEAFDKSRPLMDRLKFLAITESNMDEFFMVRIAGLLDQIAVGFTKEDPSGFTPKQQIKMLVEKTHELVNRQYSCLNKSLLPELKKAGIEFLSYERLSDDMKAYVSDYFDEVCYPILTPMGVDNSRPFPLLSNNSLNLAVKLKEHGETHFAIIQVPSVIPRMLRLPEGEHDCYIFLEEIIKSQIEKLFSGVEVQGAYAFRVTLNADLEIDEDEAEDLLIEIERSIKKRKWGAPVRLSVDHAVTNKTLSFLMEQLGIHRNDVYAIHGPLDLNIWMKFSFQDRYDALRSESWKPQPAQDFIDAEDIFERIREGDCLLHHPYESFDTVIEFIKKASVDPQVLAIKQTLYRVSSDSPIISALIRAAENGKQVTVLVELKARFDEENNVIWAKKLERAGCHVIYGLVGLKTHCKTIMVVRQEDDGIRRYVHMGTGNYNDSTAKLYTDMGMFTCREPIGADVSDLFNQLTGFYRQPRWRELEVAPLGLREFFVKSINMEIENAKKGREAGIIAKVNSLVDQEIIEKLYEASNAGVDIELNVRGVCSLRPGVPGMSDRIKVKSIVGSFLEHTRIYYFHNDGDPQIYLSSADWMPRNLDRRVELAFPVVQKNLKQRVLDVLDITLKDTIKTRIMDSDGEYKFIDRRGREPLNAQEYFCEEALSNAKRNQQLFRIKKVD